MTNNPSGRVAGPLQAFVLLLPATLAVMASAALAPGLPQLHAAFRDVPGEEWLVPMILTLPSLCLIVGSPIAGALGDRFGRRKLLLWGLVIYAVIGMAPLVLDTLPAILVSRVGVGFAEAFALTLSTTLIGDFFIGRERDRWLGYQAALTAGSAILFVGLTGFLGTFGWRAPFAIYALPLVFALLVLVFTWEPSVRHGEETRLVAPFSVRPMLSVLAVTLFASISFYVAQIQSGVALAAVGLTEPAKIGMLIGVASLGTLAGALLFRFICHWPIARLLLTAFGLIGIGYVAVGMSPGAGALTAGMFVAQFGCGLLLPSLLTFVLRDLAPEVRGRGTGAWQGVFSVGQFLSPLSMTVAGAALSGTLSAFVFFGVLNVVAAVAAAMMLTRGTRRAASPA
ncbi:MFS transporter [Sphingomonas sp.]|jgi:predicted MFS family arabinose efflux permease|uniref:MFS transporter n=1 Tax=Sphingomonas sp. TaxID=28214 RepID=UPI002D7E7C37|nr:MFS transporter [Sphingomonas sp.]HEU0045398.1 MFS transporter [Sphingomonas sp.]